MRVVLMCCGTSRPGGFAMMHYKSVSSKYCCEPKHLLRLLELFCPNPIEKVVSSLYLDSPPESVSSDEIIPFHPREFPQKDHPADRSRFPNEAYLLRQLLDVGIVLALSVDDKQEASMRYLRYFKSINWKL
jgi:hypothetical protein